MGWVFATEPISVTTASRPVRVSGYRQIVFQPPGYDGALAPIPDGRLPALITATVQAEDDAEYEMLSALFDSGVIGDLEIPEGTDAWVYADAMVYGPVSWHLSPTGRKRADVTFLCPSPRPTWKTAGGVVY